MRPSRLGSKRLAPALLAALSLMGLAAGCFAGPSPLSRGFDGWVAELTEEKPRLHGILLQDVLPVYPVFGGVLGFLDWVVMNPYSFWTDGLGFNEEEAPGEAPLPEGPPRP